MKAYVTEYDRPDHISTVEIKSIDGENVVFLDGNTLPCHGALTDFWASREEAVAVSRFARKAIGHVLRSFTNLVNEIENDTSAIQL